MPPDDLLTELLSRFGGECLTRTGRKWQGAKWIRPEKRKAIYARDNHTCAYCGETGKRLSLDHIVPACNGGTNHETNLTTACETCNKSRQATPFEMHMKRVAGRDAIRRVRETKARCLLDLKPFRNA